ncbi:hypothetical protein C4579_03980 [Candidatus Microgenomates bacterium]|nr:MAG: hypothetical protein C4579_03980 [Candidatus Microgenomates bacterium]
MIATEALVTKTDITNTAMLREAQARLAAVHMTILYFAAKSGISIPTAEGNIHDMLLQHVYVDPDEARSLVKRFEDRHGKAAVTSEPTRNGGKIYYVEKFDKRTRTMRSRPIAAHQAGVTINFSALNPIRGVSENFTVPFVNRMILWLNARPNDHPIHLGNP